VFFRFWIFVCLSLFIELLNSKVLGEIGGSLSHTYRTRPTPNADENKQHLNKHIFETYNQCFDALKNAIPEKDDLMQFYVLSI
jgi:hypothetical protein